MTKLI
jgi:hypothetical protein